MVINFNTLRKIFFLILHFSFSVVSDEENSDAGTIILD